MMKVLSKQAQDVESLLVEKFRRALAHPGANWGDLTPKDVRSVKAVHNLREIDEALLDGYWPSYSVKADGDCPYPREAFVVSQRGRGRYLVAYLAAGQKEVEVSLKSKSFVREEMFPSQVKLFWR